MNQVHSSGLCGFPVEKSKIRMCVKSTISHARHHCQLHWDSNHHIEKRTLRNSIKDSYENGCIHQRVQKCMPLIDKRSNMIERCKQFSIQHG